MPGNLNRSRLGEVERRLAEIDRAVRLSRVDPSPPRQVIATGSVLSWLPPNRTSSGVFDYYRIYSPGDGDNKLVRQVPADQLYLSDGLSGTSVFVSAYNSTTGAESKRVAMSGTLFSVTNAPSHVVLVNSLSSTGVVIINYTPPANNGDFLTQDIRIPSTPDAAYEIDWGSSFNQDTPIALNDAPGARNIFHFTGIDGLWNLLSYRGYVPD